MANRKTKIINLVRDKKEQIKKNPDEAAANQRLAIAAVTGGVGSEAWKTYMRQFVSNNDPEQLRRLFAEDNTAEDQALIDNRAYLVANGVCGEGTKDLFDQNVKTIDRTLPIDGVAEVVCEPI